VVTKRSEVVSRCWW